MTSAPHPFGRFPADKDGTQISNKAIQKTDHWRLRDYLAAAILFGATAGFVAWQNSRVAVLWDLGYLLDTSWRIAIGQMPYRDFPLAHAPLTFLIQAGLIRLGGRQFYLVIAYAATAGGLATVVTWRILLRIMRGTDVWCRSAWLMATVMAAPLALVGIYSVYPHPIYDCDCILAVLFAILILVQSNKLRIPLAEAGKLRDFTPVSPEFVTQLRSCHPERSAALRRGVEGSAVVFLSGIFERTHLAPFGAGVAAVLPLLFKQNIGLPFLGTVATGVMVLFVIHLLKLRSLRSTLSSPPAFILAGIFAALLTATAAIAATAGLCNYIHWTVKFAAQRRMPGLASMVGVYAEPSLGWTLPVLAGGLILCHTRFIASLWARIAAICLIAAPFAGSLIFLFVADDAEDRADNLLALWPLLLMAALIVAVFELRRGITLGRLIPFFILAAIHGTLLSQQLWGSTYAMWPLFLVLVAFILSTVPLPARSVAMGAAAVISMTVLVCGGLYAVSLERLGYVKIAGTPPQHAEIAALRGMGTPGPFLANLDELVAFSSREIPTEDALLLLPGEDPFYYATGRKVQFPVTLFDPATDAFSGPGLMDEVRRRNVRWIVVKRELQINENPMPDREQTTEMVKREFVLYKRLRGYDVYRRK